MERMPYWLETIGAIVFTPYFWAIYEIAAIRYEYEKIRGNIREAIRAMPAKIMADYKSLVKNIAATPKFVLTTFYLFKPGGLYWILREAATMPLKSYEGGS